KSTLLGRGLTEYSARNGTFALPSDESRSVMAAALDRCFARSQRWLAVRAPKASVARPPAAPAAPKSARGRSGVPAMRNATRTIQLAGANAGAALAANVATVTRRTSHGSDMGTASR